MFAFKVFLQNNVKVSLVTKRDVIDRLGAEVPYCQQRKVSGMIADLLGRGGSDFMREWSHCSLGTQQVGSAV